MTLFKEFQLWIPGSPDSRRGQFNFETRCTCALVERLLPRVVTEGIWKAVFGCVEEVDEPGFVSTAGGVYEMQVSANPDGFFPLDDQGKKEWTLPTLERGVARLLPLVGWPPEPFRQAFAGAKALGLRNEWVWRKKASRSRKHKAEIVVHHDIRACDISLVISDRSGKELRRALLVSSPPSEFFFYYHLGTLKWFSETCVGLINRDGDQQWTVDL
jgi:hypothetical protein